MSKRYLLYRPADPDPEGKARWRNLERVFEVLHQKTSLMT